MTQSVASLIETLVSLPNPAVSEAGEVMLRYLSDGSLTAEVFRSEPRTLTGPDYDVSRYLAQVVWRALDEKYETVDQIIDALRSVLDRNPPTIESREKSRDPQKVVFPEVKILRVRQPAQVGDGSWQSSFEAQVTTGPMRDQEIKVCLRSAVNSTACFIVSYLWVHASVAAYNLVPVSAGVFEGCTETFFVLEPLRQINATSIARALDCPKPVIDQVRRGRGDVTIHTLKGMLIHALFDRILDGEGDIETHYEETVTDYLVQIAAVTDSAFDGDAFRDDVLKHARAIKEFISLNPQMYKNPQVELKRYSATIGIQGRIDAVFSAGNQLDIVELKTGKRLRIEDHRQLFIYRLLLSDWIRRREREGSDPIEVTTCLLSSYDGTSSPARADGAFAEVLGARNRLIALSYSLGQQRPHVAMRYADFDSAVCNSCPKWTHRRCVESSKLFGDRPETQAGEALEYFRSFSRKVQAEKWLSDRDLVDLLDDSRLGFRLRNFKTISDATCVGYDSGHFLFNFHENKSDLSVSDRVLVHSGLISSSLIFHGYVRSIDRTQARISIPLKNVSMTEFEGQLWIIDRFPSDVTSEASQTALYEFLVSPVDQRKSVILGDLNPLAKRDIEGVRRIERPNALNKSQNQAIQKAVRCQTFHLIWGPPGTGKTKVVPEVVRNLEGSVLLGAFTNTAVDKMLMAVLANDPKATFLRIGHSNGSPELSRRLGNRACQYFSEDLAESIRNPIELRARLDDIPLVAATAHRAASHPYLRRRNFEMTIVDEAAQLTEPLTLGLVMRARRFVLIGDDFQLPPVVRSAGLLRSMFERLKVRAEAEAPEFLTMLETQYRMHPEIMELSNRLYYSGQLSSGVQPEERQPPVGRPILFVPNEASCDGRSNQSEASAVREVVESLLKHVPAEEIGVISPFRAQVVLLNRLLEGTGVVADTVERFQGGERDVMVISFVRSRGSEFVFDDRRFNVALTRARRKLVMVAHPNLFHGTKYEWICDFTEAPPTKTPI